MIIATPIEAVIANSLIMPISMDNKVKKPTVSETKATPPGINKALKLACAADAGVKPIATFLTTEFII